MLLMTATTTAKCHKTVTAATTANCYRTAMMAPAATTAATIAATTATTSTAATTAAATTVTAAINVSVPTLRTENNCHRIRNWQRSYSCCYLSCVCVWLSDSLLVCLFCLFVCLFACLFCLFLSFCLFVCLYVCLLFVCCRWLLLLLVIPLFQQQKHVYKFAGCCCLLSYRDAVGIDAGMVVAVVVVAVAVAVLLLLLLMFLFAEICRLSKYWDLVVCYCCLCF